MSGIVRMLEDNTRRVEVVRDHIEHMLEDITLGKTRH